MPPPSQSPPPPRGARPSHPPKRLAKRYRTEIASSLATVASTLGASPADAVKTQMQSYKFASALTCARHIYHTEGPTGFYRGQSAPLASFVAVRTLCFSINQKAKYSISEAISRFTGGEEPLVTVNRPGSTPTPGTLATFGGAGMVAGALTSVVGCPFELTKMFAQMSLGAQPGAGAMLRKQQQQQQQQQQQPKTRPLPVNNWNNDAIRKSYQNIGAFKTAANIVRLRGILGLWSGFQLHLLRETLATGIYFTTYESAKQLLVMYQKKDSPTALSAVTMAGGVSGLVSWGLTYPIDMVKTKYQRNCLVRVKGDVVPRPTFHWFEARGYRGLGVTILRSFIGNAIFFSLFELIKKEINQLEDSPV